MHEMIFEQLKTIIWNGNFSPVAGSVWGLERDNKWNEAGFLSPGVHSRQGCMCEQYALMYDMW